MTEIPPAPSEPFGSVFAPEMSVARFDGAVWSAAETVELDSFSLHPGTHALHYGSSCFEGLKAHRQPDGSVRSFRPDAHVARLRQSAARLCLPVPPAELATELIELAVAAAGHLTPASPGALYVRPTMLGTDITIGSAAAPSATAMVYVLACPVGEYLPPGRLTVAVETVTPRTTPQFGVVKTGANYAMALAPIMEARRRSGADQVLFAPGGVVQETGASNVLLLDGDELRRRPSPTATCTASPATRCCAWPARWAGASPSARSPSTTVASGSPGPAPSWRSPARRRSLPPSARSWSTTSPSPSARAGEPAHQQLRAALLDIQTGRAAFDW